MGKLLMVQMLRDLQQTIQLQLMEAETVRDQAQSLELVTPILVQVTNVCLTPFVICNMYCFS